MAWLPPAPTRPAPSTSTVKAQLAVAISILRLKPSHLAPAEFLSFLQQVFPRNSRLKDIDSISFYRQLAAFSTSTFQNLRLELLDAKANARKEETDEGEETQNGNKRKGMKDAQKDAAPAKKRKTEGSKSEPMKPPSKPLATLRPYAPLIQGTPHLHRAIYLLKSNPSAEAFMEAVNALTTFFANGLSKLWTVPITAEEDAKVNPKVPTKQAAKKGPKIPVGSVGSLYKAIDALVKLVLQTLDGLVGPTSADSKEGSGICISTISLLWAIAGCIYQNSISIIQARISSSSSNQALDIRNGLVDTLVVALSRLRPTDAIQRSILESIIAMLLDSASVFMFFPTVIDEKGGTDLHDLEYGRVLWEDSGRHFLRLLTVAISAMEMRVLPRGKQSCQPWLLNARERLQERLSAAVLASINHEGAVSKRRDMPFERFSADVNGDYVNDIWALLGVETIPICTSSSTSDLE